jgi:hypothetical protein
LSKTDEHRAWRGLRNRCMNPRNKDYADYGGRGLTVDPRWDDFLVFLADMGLRPTPKHSVERRDNSKGYSPENCYWGTRAEQGANKRNNRMLTYQGLTLHLSEWARRIGITKESLHNRVRKGWPIELILSPERFTRSRRVRNHNPPMANHDSVAS